MSGWRLLEEEILCSSPWLTVAREKVATPSRPPGVDWMVARRPVAAVVVPRMPSGYFVMIRQERVAVRRETWEFPAGQVDGAVTAETILATAHRELGEEAGLRCVGELVPLGMVFSSVGFTTECCHLFLAPEVVPAPELTLHDAHEAIHEVKEVTAAEFRSGVADGSISDCNTLAVFARLAAMGLM